MGRAPCCDKANVKKGPWSPEEDATLKSYIDQNGTGGNWIALPQKIGLKRCGKSCRLRWLNYLRPNIKHGGFSEEEDNMICSLYINIGSRWSIIAAQLPGRTDNDIKNYWNTRLKKKLLGKQRKEQAISAQARRRANNFTQETNREIFNSRQNPNFNETNTIDHHRLQSPFGPYHTTSHMPFWPELPPAMEAPASGHSSGDSSVKNLLVKLEGRFSDGTLTYEYHNHHLLASGQGQTYQAPSFDALTSNTYGGESSSGYDQSQVFQLGLENLQAELNELINYSNYQPEDEQLAALNGINYEGLYGFEYQVANGSSVSANSTASLESSSSSMANYHPNMVYDYSYNDNNQVIIDV